MAVAVALTVVVFVQQSRWNDCITRWADRFSTRSMVLSAATTARNDALDKFLRSLATRNETTELRAYRGYLAASDMYRKAAAANPPPPPKLRC
jgi:hypothetical protein